MSARTVLVLPAWYPTPERPLAGPFTRDHARAAATFGHRMVVFLDEGPVSGLRGLFELSEEQDGALRVVRFRYRPGTGRLVHLPGLLLLARRLAGGGSSVDLIHAHIHRMAWPAAILGGLLRRPFVVTENSSEWPRGTIEPGALRRARIAFPRAALVCPVNERLRQAIEGYGVRGSFRVVPNTVDTAVFHPPDARAAGPPTRLVNVAGHVKVKALDVLLRKHRAGRLIGTAEVPQKADGIAAVPRTVSSCQQRTHALQQILLTRSPHRHGRGELEGWSGQAPWRS